ncbi:glyoxalase [Arthrobacter sp. ZBG10]|uniref:VOC family protein n=1 Tax=Arthrobacter sp. ZBG10 TaxID=1676590 RepID=UPI0006815E22|nr:VOC family protein [Arthrobacter sp. ZBG10]KNH16640.1 glyoxalase [Arthrobacter sp. ZBG10]
MPTPDFINGSPCWIDLMTSDTDQACAFYGSLFGWEFEVGDTEKYGGYIMAARNGSTVAGIMARQPDQVGMPDLWSVYLRTDDAAATADAVVAHGGSIHLGPLEVPDQGTMLFFQDSAGAATGAWQPGAMHGFDIAAEPGAPAWFELHAKDYQGALEFYTSVFGWHPAVLSDTPEFRYATSGEGENAHAGVMDASAYLPADVPPHWQVYFAVDDADASVAAALTLGATLLEGPQDSGFGRVAQLADPTGARFRIVEDNRQQPAG